MPMAPAAQLAGSPALLSMNASASSKVLGGDLDSSLANLVGNLGMSATTVKKGDLQWNAGEKKLTGGANWQPKVAPATWATGTSPSGGTAPPPSAINATPVASGSPVAQPAAGFGMPAPGASVPMMPQQPMMFSQPRMRPPFGGSPVAGAPLSPSTTPVSQSPKKQPTKDPLADLNIKDFL